jgi:CyaY protein
MDEREFDTLADTAMADIEQAIESCSDDIDYEAKPGGVLEISFEDGSKVIVNKHRAAREIWVAARSGGFHFKPEAGRWIAARDGDELMQRLSHCLSEQSQQAVHLHWPD